MVSDVLFNWNKMNVRQEHIPAIFEYSSKKNVLVGLKKLEVMNKGIGQL
jgi:hypothetical protein